MREHQIGGAIRDAVNLGFAQIYTKPHTKRMTMKGAANFAGGCSMVWDALRMQGVCAGYAQGMRSPSRSFSILGP